MKRENDLYSDLNHRLGEESALNERLKQEIYQLS